MKILNYIFIIFISCITIVYANVPTTAAKQIIVIKPYSMAEYNKEFTQFYFTHPQSQNSEMLTRLITDSGFFLGKPYVLGALGEGPTAEFDQSPLYRTDAFDCMTYVSTVLAMAESTSFKQFHDNMLKIQYSNGIPTYGTRNHFTCVDWNSNNQRHGYFTDVTKKLFQNDFAIATTIINKPAWFGQLPASNIKKFHTLTPLQTIELLQKMHDISKQTKIEISKLAYVPLTALFDKNSKAINSQFDKIPNGSIIEIVRPNWDLTKSIGTHLNVSHMGFAIRINHILMFREASLLDHKVEDVPLAKYLSNYLKSSTVKGINIQQINLIN